jgi:hypothetical protein
MKLFSRNIFILLFFSITSSCSLTGKALSMKHAFYTDNTNYDKAELKFIEETLIKSETIQSLGHLYLLWVREIESQNIQNQGESRT